MNYFLRRVRLFSGNVNFSRMTKAVEKSSTGSVFTSKLTSSASRFTKDDGTSCNAAINFFGSPEQHEKRPILSDPKITAEWVRSQIPAHLFERSMWKTLTHVAHDLFFIALLGYAGTFISSVPFPLQFVLWPLYWFAQGTVMTGIWVIAHEAGHSATSPYSWFNNTLGWILHSSLFVPFFSWKISHSNHHSNTCSVEHDEVFVPHTLSEFDELVSDTPLAHFIDVLKMLFFGWPGYLIANFSGPKKYNNGPNSHFNPKSLLYLIHQRGSIVISDIGIALAFVGLAYAVLTFGVSNVFFYYFCPYLVVNMYLVTITYLQHTETYVPHYREKEFTWLRGALCTIDRSWGWLIDHFIHHIADTHLVHHMFSTLPFYNAQEATKILREVLSDYYMRDDTPIFTAVMKAWPSCKYIDDEGDIVYFKDATALNKEVAKQLNSKNKKKN